MSEETFGVFLTLKEIRGLRMGLTFGVPEKEPKELVSAQKKLGEAQLYLEEENKGK